MFVVAVSPAMLPVVRARGRGSVSCSVDHVDVDTVTLQGARGEGADGPSPPGDSAFARRPP